MNKSSFFCQLNLLQAFLPWARPSGRSSKSNQLGDFLPPHCLVDLAWKCMKETDGWGKMWLKWIISKPRHVMLKQGQEKWSCHCFFPKHCSPGSKWKGPVLVESICNPKTPSPSLQRGLLPRVCVMRMATLKVCHTSFWLIWDSINPSVRCARKSLRECHFWKVITIFPKGYILNSKSPLRWLSQPLSMCTQVLRRAVPMKLQLHSTFGLANETPQKLERLGFNLGKLMCQSTGTTSKYECPIHLQFHV